MHTGPLILNISLTINIAVIDVKLSQSERKGERGQKRKREEDKEGRREVEEKKNTDCRNKATELIWILLVLLLQ